MVMRKWILAALLIVGFSVGLWAVEPVISEDENGVKIALLNTTEEVALIFYVENGPEGSIFMDMYAPHYFFGSPGNRYTAVVTYPQGVENPTMWYGGMYVNDIHTIYLDIQSDLLTGLFEARNAGADEVAIGIVYSDTDTVWYIFEDFQLYFKILQRAIHVN
jgi:(2Fe-2S) ferredoxin